MQKIKISAILLAIIGFSSCQFNQSVNTDMTTGAYTRGDGLSSDDVIIKINGKAEKRNEFIHGERVNLIFDNVTGLKESENKTYPGTAMYIIKNEKDTVLSEPNLLKNLEEGTDLSIIQIQADFKITRPTDINDKYKVHVQIFDKKSDGKLTYELPFTIKNNDLLKVESNGITYSELYLWNESQKHTIVDKNLSSDDAYILILDNVEGLEVINDKVFPIFSIEITDASGNKIISNPNILSAYETEGVDPANLKKQLIANITFSKGKLNNPCTLVTKLTDKNSDKQLVVRSELFLD